jgi:hypothetical protein
MTAPTLPEDSPALREQAIATARALNVTGINVNKAGNVSVRCMRGAQAGFIITPSALPYDALTPEALVFVRVGDGRAQGRRRPSSEWRFHHDLYAARPEFAASCTRIRRTRPHSPATGAASRPFTTWSRRPAAPTSAARRTRPSARRNSPTPRSPQWPAAARACSRTTA